MEFTNLKEAISYAQTNNMDVQKQGNKWAVIEKTTVPLNKIIEDLQKSIEELKASENPNMQLIQQMEEELEEIKKTKQIKEK